MSMTLHETHSTHETSCSGPALDTDAVALARLDARIEQLADRVARRATVLGHGATPDRAATAARLAEDVSRLQTMIAMRAAGVA